MTFRSELTWERMRAEGREEEYHSSYEQAADELLTTVKGAPIVYPNHIDGAPSLARDTFDDRSPSHPDILVGRFQRSTSDEVSRAVSSARQAFLEWSRTDWGDR